MTGWVEVSDATWPAAARHSVGPFLVREGLGGGQRASAATAEADWNDNDIVAVEALCLTLRQRPLFMIRKGEDALDAALAARGYALRDPVDVRIAETQALAATPARPMTTFPLWPPLAIMRDIWAAGGIGPGRLAVMGRAEVEKTAILGRASDRAAGVAYVAGLDGTAMLHALYILPDLRRQGTGANITRRAAAWAGGRGFTQFCVQVMRANTDAGALYASLGLAIVESYHYRAL